MLKNLISAFVRYQMEAHVKHACTRSIHALGKTMYKALGDIGVRWENNICDTEFNLFKTVSQRLTLAKDKTHCIAKP